LAGKYFTDVREYIGSDGLI